MKKLVIILSLLILFVGCQNSECDSDNAAVCEIEVIEDFEVEAAAKIKIGFYHKQFADDFINEIESLYPELSDVYTYEIIDENQLELADFDIIQTKVENVPLLFSQIMPLDESFRDLLNNEVIHNFSKFVNQEEHYFMPFDYEGLLFAYNKTILEAFNVDLTDADNNGLPDAIDSFEKIAELAEAWRQQALLYNDDQLEAIFSFPLNDQLAMLSFFENSGYKLISGSKAEDMDVGANLATALAQLEILGEKAWYFDKSKVNEMVWNYESALENQSAPFMLVGNWMFYEQYQKSQAFELVFSKLPSLNDEDLATLSSVSGFVVNEKTLYPQAANLLIKLLKDEVGILSSLKQKIVPVVDPLFLDSLEVTIEPNLNQQIKAYSYSNIIDLHAFESNPQLLGFRVFYEVDFRDIFKAVFLNELSKEAAQIEIIERIITWYKDNELDYRDLEKTLEQLLLEVSD